MISTPTSKNIRLTISVTPEVHATFERFAKAAGMSLGRAMGEWLGDTVEAAELLAHQLERARAAPKLAIREMHSFALGLADDTGDLMKQMTAKGKADRASVHAQRAPVTGRLPIPPSCNTGGKLPGRSTPKRKGGSL